MSSEKSNKFKAGMSFSARVPFSQPNTAKVHIDHVLPSYYSDVTLIIYRVFGKHKQWWHEFMCTKEEMELYIELTKK